MTNYKKLYLKYKIKYINLKKKIYGGMDHPNVLSLLNCQTDQENDYDNYVNKIATVIIQDMEDIGTRVNIQGTFQNYDIDETQFVYRLDGIDKIIVFENIKIDDCHKSKGIMGKVFDYIEKYADDNIWTIRITEFYNLKLAKYFGKKREYNLYFERHISQGKFVMNSCTKQKYKDTENLVSINERDPNFETIDKKLEIDSSDLSIIKRMELFKNNRNIPSMAEKKSLREEGNNILKGIININY